MGVQFLSVNVDSKLVASQINGNYEACKESMIWYLSRAKEYISCFKNFKIQNIPRNKNQKADVLSKLALVAFNHLTKDVLVKTLDMPSTDMKEINAVVEEEGETWMTPIVNCLERGIWSEDQHEARAIRMKIGQLCNSEDSHGGMQHALKGKAGGSKSHPARVLLANNASRCNGRNTQMRLVYGLPKIIVTDNGTNFIHDPFRSWCKKLNITQINTAVTHPQANGLVERANRILMEGIKTRLGRERKGWVEELPNVLWAHRTSLKTSNRETPYNLTFGSEAVIPAEIGMPTHRTMMIKEGNGNEEEMRLNLDLLTERREASVIREAQYKTKVEYYYNKRVRPMSFKVGEHVYRKNEASRVENLGKLGPKWEGLYLVVEAYQNGSYKLRIMDDCEMARYLRPNVHDAKEWINDYVANIHVPEIRCSKDTAKK
ncbi:reverse transcriptase domain-containing protein [Tanacetum coccineum]